VKRPNILFIHTDQQRWDALGANGNSEIRTPHLDALATEGINFDHCFVQSTVCMPSRMSYLTGMYPSSLGIVRNGRPLSEDTLTLPKILGNYGYFSGNIGKLHFLPHSNRDHRIPHPSYGFDHLEISDEPGCYEDAYRQWVRCKVPDQLDLISLGLPPAAEQWRAMMGITEAIRHPQRVETRPIPFPARSDLTHSAFVAERTAEFLRAHRDETFLCVAGFFAPHAPLVVPQEFLDMYDPDSLKIPEFPPELDRAAAGEEFSDEWVRSARQGYYAAVSEVDRHVGSILGALRELGLTDETIVVFTSDHGEYLGEHLKYGKGYPGEDCITRVPLILRFPRGGVGGRTTVREIVESVDLVPTLLSLVGIPAPPTLQGQGLPVSGGEIRPRRSALTEGPGWKSIRTADFRYVLRRDGSELLFDMRSEFAEYRNIAQESKYAPALSEVRGELARRIIDSQRELPRTAAY